METEHAQNGPKIAYLTNLLAKMDQRIAKVETIMGQGFGQIEALLQRKETVKEFYTTKELAQLLGKKEYTVREWCRLERVAAKKLPGGRGNEGEWRIPHEELIRYRTDGLLPLSPQAAMRY
jgi:hypothetical protein